MIKKFLPLAMSLFIVTLCYNCPPLINLFCMNVIFVPMTV